MGSGGREGGREGGGDGRMSVCVVDRERKRWKGRKGREER